MSAPTFAVPHAVSHRLHVLQRLFEILRRDGRTSLDVLEVGTYEGQSALFWSQLIGELFPQGGSVRCIDPWRSYLSDHGGEIYERSDRALVSGEAFQQFQKNLEFAHPKAPITFFKGTLAEAIERDPMMRGRRFGLVYLDGDHRYRAICDDIENSLNLVSLGGFLCGDDLERVLFAHEVEDARRYKNVDYINGYHPGVSLAIHETFGENVWAEHGVWAVKMELRAGVAYWNGKFS